MKQSTFRCVSTLLLALGLAYAQESDWGYTPEVESDGVLSVVEDLPKPGNSEGLYRQTPFVEVIHKEGLDNCREAGFDQEQCPTFEWSLPFLPSSAATDAEVVIAEEWFRLETKAYFRTLLEIGAAHPALACTLGGLDIFWLIYTGDIFFPPEEFCDDKGFQILANCFWECDFNLLETQCPDPKVGCEDCVREAVKNAWEHIQSEYYPDYQRAVVEKVVVPLTAAGGLLWSEDPLLSDGALVSPIGDVTNIPNVLGDVATTLIPEGVKIDPRAATYYTQTAAPPPQGDIGCRRALLAGAKFGLIRLPGQTLDPSAPGLPPLEDLKRTLADRESAGETYKRTLMMLLKWSKEEIYPKYTEGEGFLSNVFSGEEAKFGTADPGLYACLGYTTFFEVYQKLVDPVVSVYRPITRPSVCWIEYIPGLTLVPLLPEVMIWANPRWHTEWAAVPEGFDIPNVKGEPQNGALRP